MDFFSLKIGDTFIEDYYPEVWKVTAASAVERGMTGVNSVCVGYISDDKRFNTGRVGETSFWGCSESAYCPDVYLIKEFYVPKED